MTNVVTLQAELAIGCEDELGECPLWDHRTNKVVWIDIPGQRFREFDPKTNILNTFDLPDVCGSICLSNIGTPYIFSFTDGMYFYDYKRATVMKKIWDYEPKNNQSRLNDGRVDRYGNFVAGGYLYNGAQNPKVLTGVYRLFPDLTYQKIINNISCTNSICFNLKGDIMYLTDSHARLYNGGTRTIERYQYDGNNNTRKLPIYLNNYVTENAKIDKAGFDGSIIDSQGYLWNAKFNGGCVERYDTNGNSVMKIIIPDNKYITCLCFGGENLSTLYITCAASKYSNEERQAKKGLLGGLYRINLEKYNIRGLRENVFGVNTISNTRKSKL